ncbi:hypothetical protein ACVIM8_001780 [Bradyrhizobium sp. USDA 4529]
MHRRNFLYALAASVAAPAVVRGQSKKIDGVVLNVNGYGSDYDRLLNTLPNHYSSARVCE